MNLEKLLMTEPDSVLLDIQMELLSGKVPATGYAHTYNRKVNRMIDAGELCMDPFKYRKIYLPTLARAVQREMARRYVNVLRFGKGADNAEY